MTASAHLFYLKLPVEAALNFNRTLHQIRLALRVCMGVEKDSQAIQNAGYNRKFYT